MHFCGSTMLYYLLRPLARLTFLAFYRKIYLTGIEHIPRRGPVIYAVNHPTAFIEAVFLACFAPRSIYYMTRGDVFVNPLVRWLLAQVHLIPIYRFVDGFSNLRNNAGSFAEAQAILGRNGTVLVMAEGRMAHEKRLRNLQRGAARIGFRAMNQFQLPDVHIVPIAVNYTYAERGRREVMVDIAPALSLADYLPQYEAEPKGALRSVTDKIEEALRARVIHIEQPEDDELAEHLLRLVRYPQQENILPIVHHAQDTLFVEHRTMQMWSALSTEERSHFAAELTAFVQACQEAGVDDELAGRQTGQRPWPTWLWAPAWLITHLCRLIHLLPVWLPGWLTPRVVKTVEFRSSVLMGILMFSWGLWFLLIVVLSGLLFSWWVALWVGALLLLAAGGVVVGDEVLKAFQRQHRWRQVDVQERNRISEMRQALRQSWFSRLERGSEGSA